ncbi:MAG TPA: HepT-like ribonuclease domain-containing protein [Acidobacteriaceae bacterium]|nr:HepT-like ribonuclease domain-containing protein [Acidobacteriaceae bacterium]
MHLRDILESIDLIDSFLGEMDFESYCNDPKTKSAVERQMQILTEAAIRLEDEADVICPGPDWRGFRRMGNVLRHMYHRVDDEIVWNTVKEELPELRAAVVRALG